MRNNFGGCENTDAISGIHDFFFLQFEQVLEVRDCLVVEALDFLFCRLDGVLAGCQLVGFQLLDTITSDLPEFLLVLLRIVLQLLHGFQFQLLGVTAHLGAGQHFPDLLDLEIHVARLEHFLDLVDDALIEHAQSKHVVRLDRDLR